MTAVPLLDSHKGCHCRKPSSPVASFFRSLVRQWLRKRTVPADVQSRAAGAGTALIGGPHIPADRFATESEAWTGLRAAVERMGQQHPATDPGMPVLRDRWTWEVRAEHDAQRHADAMHGASLPYLPPVPRRPVNGRLLGDLPRRQPAATLNRAPWETGSFTVPGDVTLVPAYGTVPVARVLEAERLASVMRP